MNQKFRMIILVGLMTLSHALLPAVSSDPFAGLVDIGGGRKMYLECRGSGSPAVVLVSGRSDRADIWRKPADSDNKGPTVFGEAAKFSRVCVYDRPGTVTITAQSTVEPSRSNSVPQPTTPENSVVDLHALLTAAEVPAPYVLVGHSYGGLIVRLYASTYPNEVSGLVLIDTLTEMLYDALTPAQQAMWVRLNSNYSPDLDRYTIQERSDLVSSFEQVRTARALRPMPVIVLTSDQPYDFRALVIKGILPSDTPVDFGPIVFQAHLAAQERMTQLLHAKHITNTHSGHYIQNEQPQLVIEAIREVVEAVRKGGKTDEFQKTALFETRR